MKETNNLLKKLRPILFICLMSFLIFESNGQALFGTKTIGTTGDYPSFTTAITALTTNGVSGPIVFNIEAGSYNEQISIPVISGASATNTITFKGLGDLTTISATTLTTNRPVICFDGSSHIILDNIKIEALGTYGIGVLFVYADSIMIKQCHITAPTADGNNYCIATSTSISSVLNTTNTADYISIIDNTLEGGNTSIYLKSKNTSFATDIHIENNQILEFGVKGIELSNVNNVDLIGNTVSSNQTAANACFSAWDAGDNLHIDGNYMYIGPSSTALKAKVFQLSNATSDAGDATLPRFVTNNIFHYDGSGYSTSSSNKMVIIYIKNLAFVKLYNNTIKMSGNASYAHCLWLDHSKTSSADNIEVRNNIFYMESNQSSSYFVYNAAKSNYYTNLVASNNNYYTTGTRFAIKYPSGPNTQLTFTSLANYQNNSYTSTTFGLGSVSIDPSFLSSTDLRSSNISMNNLGTPIAAVTKDIDGNLRDASTPDMGANEYSPAADELVATALLTPVDGESAGSAITISMRISNQGIASQTNVPVFYSIDGATAIEDTLLSIDAIGGANEIVDFVFTVPASITTLGEHNIKVYIGLSTDVYTANDTLSEDVFICSSLNGSFTIGGSNSDYATFTDALFALNNCGITGAVVFNVAAGTYNERIVLPYISGSSAINTITFKGLGAQTLITFAPTTSDRSVVKLDGAKHIILDSLSIQATGTYGYGILLRNSADSNIIKNNIIELPISILDNYQGIVASNSNNDYDGSGDNANYLLIENNTIIGGYIGLGFFGKSTSDLGEGIVFRKNTLIRQYYASIYIKYALAPKVLNNNIKDAVNSSYNGIYLYNCDEDLNVSNNIIDGSNATFRYGIYLYRCDATSSKKGLIANNMVSGNTSGSSDYAYYQESSKYQQVYNNSFNTFGSSGYAFYISSSNGDNIIENNIFSNMGGGVAAYFVDATSASIIDYNNYYSSGSKIAKWESDTKTDLAALQAASLQDVNSISTNPIFISNTDLHTMCVAMNNKGAVLSLITTDIDGDLRDATTPDMGADEYTPPANELSIVEIISPIDISDVNASQVISVRVANNATASQINVPIFYSIDGAVAIEDTLLSIDAYGGTNDIIDFDFTVKADLSALGNHTIKVYTALVNDVNKVNDTISKNAYTCGSFSGAYTIGGTTADFENFAEALKAINTCGIAGPVVFNVNPGTYNENLELSYITGTSAINTITFKGLGEQTIITYAPDYSNKYVVSLNGAKHIILDSLKIMATGTYGYGILLRNEADSNIIRNNIIEVPNGSSSSYCGIVVSDNNSNYQTTGNNANDLFIENNTIIGGYYGIVMYGTSESDLLERITIKNNTMQKQYTTSIYMKYILAPKIIGNHIIDGFSTSFIGFNLNYCDEDMTLANNIIDASNTILAKGIYISYCDGTSTKKGLIANNIVTGETVGTLDFAYNQSSSKYQQIYNNTFNTIGSSGYAFYISGGNDNEVVNNCFTNMGGGYAASYSAASVVNTVDNNNYYTTGTDLAKWSYSTKTDLAALQTASSKDANSISFDPIFSSTTDFHVHEPALDGAASALAVVSTDIDGDLRDLSTPDIGAYEFTSYTHDLAIVGLTRPNSGVCGMDDDLLIVEYSNFGTTTLTNVIVKAKIGTQTLSRTIASVAFGETDTLRFAHANTSIAGEAASIVVYHDLGVMDLNITNDTLKSTLAYNPLIDLGQDQAVCSNSSIVLDAGTNAANTFVWSNTITTQTNNIDGSTLAIGSNEFSVIVTTTEGCIGKDTINVIANTLPTVIATGDATICAGDSAMISLNFTGASPWSIAVDINGSQTINETGLVSPFTTYTDPSITSKYTLVSLTDANGCISTGRLDSVTISVNQLPAVTATATDNPVTYGFSTTLNGDAIGGSGNYSYSWTPSASINGSAIVQNPTTIGMNLATPFTLTVVDQTTSCKNTADLLLNISGGPLTANPTSSDDTVCMMDSVVLNALSSGGGSSHTYSWVSKPAGFTSTIANPKAEVTTDTWFILTVTDGANTVTDSVMVNAFALPTATTTATTASICIGDSSQLDINLTGLSPWNVYLNDGNSSSKITLTSSTLESWKKPNTTTTYTVDSIVDNNGCSNTSTAATIITVNNLPTVSFTGLANEYCIDASAATLTGNIIGGTFTGTGITGSTFDPSISGAGSFEIIYTATDANSCTNSNTQTVVVNSLPTVSFTGLANEYCVDASAATLTGNIIGGTFTGTGISGTSFDPTTAGAGSFDIIYTATDANTCTNSDTQTVVVNSLPTLSFSGLANEYCIDAGAATLSGNISGGIFFGTGVIGSTFVPSIAGAGNFDVVYTATDANACTNSDTQSVIVNALPNVSFTGLANDYCADASAATLTGNISGGTFTGTGITGTSFDASTSGAGIFDIVYTATDANTCSNSDTQSVIVNALPNVNFTGLANAYCVDASAATLTGNISGGTFTGTGITGTSFDPSTAGAGSFDIVYTATDANTCTNSDTQTVVVNSLPTVSFTGLANAYCADASAATLTGNIIGGTFTGTGISGSTFDVSTAGAGSFDIIYTATDANTCTNSDTQTVVVNSLPTVSFTGLANAYCADASAATLTGNIIGGTFTGTGISGTSFDPSTAGAGSFDIVYTATDANTCTNSDTQSVIVNALPTVSFTGLNNTYCNNDAASSLTGLPAGGTYSGNGISTNSYDPSISGVGTFNIVYSYTDLNTCTNTDTQSVVVNGITSFSLGNDTSSCDQYTLTAVSGTSYLWSTSETTQSIVATQSATYSVDLTNQFGCISSDSIILTINDSPIINLGNDTSLKMSWTSLVLDPGVGFASYVWNDLSTNQTYTVDPSAMTAGTSTYSVVVMDANNCTATDSIDILILNDVGISDADDLSSIKIYPNPSIGIVTLEIEGMDGSVELNLYDSYGKLLQNEFLNDFQNGMKKEIDLQSYAKGIYYLRIVNANKNYLRKLILN